MSSTQPQRGGRQPRTGGSGGRALMLLGVVLALVSGVLVIYLVSNATSNAGRTEPVVVANQNIQEGTPLSPSDFTVKSFLATDVPTGAYPFTTQDSLNVLLNGTYATENIIAGDILMQNDPRIAKGPPNIGSLANNGPVQLKQGYVLFPFSYSDPNSGAQSFIVAGDHIDVIVTECGADFTTNSCATQTTFQDVVVYATLSGTIVVMMQPQYAESLKALVQTGNVTLAVRDPQDTTQPGTFAVTPSYLASEFHFNQTP